MASAPEVRAAVAGDEARWRELWDGYLHFYHQRLDEVTIATTWRRVLEPGSGMFCRLAVVDGTAVGFAIGVLHPGTWTAAPICYLEDLYVETVSRGAGVGRALIDDVVGLARANGWSRLYWHTEADNIAARALYDRFVAADGFVRYRMFLG
ncbi:MAG: GNAT family N-acetyltransferase [Hyphomicrobiaceae bacterium]